MKTSRNCWVIPTDKPSRLRTTSKGKFILSTIPIGSKGETQNIYITSDEEITGFENNIWVYNNGRVWLWQNTMAIRSDNKPKKIILTTDQDLIKDGVQAIPDEFLEWFVKNPSCEEVEVKWTGFYKPVKNEETDIPEFDCYEYKVIIPKEEPKITNCGNKNCQSGVINGVNPKICRKCNPKEEPKLTNVCIKCGVDLYYTPNFTCQEHPKNCKGIHLSEKTLKERALKEEPKQECKDCNKSLEECTCIEDTVDMKQEIIEKHYLATTSNPLIDVLRMKQKTLMKESIQQTHQFKEWYLVFELQSECKKLGLSELEMHSVLSNRFELKFKL